MFAPFRVPAYRSLTADCEMSQMPGGLGIGYSGDFNRFWSHAMGVLQVPCEHLSHGLHYMVKHISTIGWGHIL